MFAWIHMSYGDTKWYNHNPDRDKDGIFIEKYGAVQFHFSKVVLCEGYQQTVPFAQIIFSCVSKSGS